MRRLLIASLLTGFVGTVAGCLALMPVSSHVERGIDFDGYRTYDWGPADALPVADERLSKNPFFVDEVHGAIDVELNSRGLVRATSQRADLLVHYHAAVTERLEVASPAEQFRDCVGADCRPRVTEYDAGTLVIDLVDTASRRLIWRGWAEHRLEDMLDDPAQVRRRVQEAVTRIFATLPLTKATAQRRMATEDAR